MPDMGQHKQRESSAERRDRRKLFRWRVERLKDEETRKVFQKEVKSVERFEAVLTSIDEGKEIEARSGTEGFRSLRT